MFLWCRVQAQRKEIPPTAQMRRRLSGHLESTFPMTNRQLRWWYGRYNKLYFKGLLPKPKKMYFSRTEPLIGRCQTTCACGSGPFEVRFICINQKIRFAEKLCLITLLHEMIHAHLFSKNIPHECKSSGDSFIKEVWRLSRAGAYDRLL